jgi:hypothetical protein
MKSLISSAVLLALLVLSSGCATPPPPPKGFTYENVKKENSATILQTGTMGFFALAYGHGIASGDVDQIDGKECGVNYTEPVFIAPGKHALTFRFVVSNAGREGPATVYQSANLELKAGETYKITAVYKAKPAPCVDFKLMTGEKAETIFFQCEVPIIN